MVKLKLMLMAGGSKLMLILKLMLVKLKLVLGGWAAVLPRVQLAASLPSLPSIPSLLEPGQDMGSSRQEGERGQQSTWPHKPACLFCHSPAQAVHCIVAYAAAYIFYLLSTLSVCGLFQTGQWPLDQEQPPLGHPD